MSFWYYVLGNKFGQTMKTKISFDGLLAIWFFSLSLLKKMDRQFLLLDIFVEKNNFYAFIWGGSDQLPWFRIHHIGLTCFHLLLPYGKAWFLINENQINQILWHICVCPCPKLSTYQVLLLWYAGMNFNWFTCVY